MFRLVTTLSAEYQGSIVPMPLGNTVVQAPGPARACRASPLAVTFDRVALHHCANHHQTVVQFISTARSMSRTGAARPTATA